MPDVGVDRDEEDCGLCRLGYSVGIIPEVTLTDVASFAPAPVPLLDEPGGAGIVNRAVNFVINANTTTSTGSLFDLPVTVHFTPTAYTFHPGDDTSYTTTTGGHTWQTTASPQFTATDTSHAYTERGTYTAHATVHYTATVDFGNGPTTIPGTIDIPTGTTTIRIVSVHTALVQHTCTEDPTGPGC